MERLVGGLVVVMHMVLAVPILANMEFVPPYVTDPVRDHVLAGIMMV